MPRRRHPKKDLEEVCRIMERAGWTILTPKSGYFKGRCPCGKHSRSIHLSPSDPNYGRNLLQWCSRKPCWPEEEEQ